MSNHIMLPLQALLVILLCQWGGATAVASGRADHDLCGASSPFTGKQQAVACYAGFFLTKMLGELNTGQNKTAEHVRIHLLPYLGGAAALSALRSDRTDDAGCRICFSDPATAKGLTGLRASLPAEAREAYDALEPCYHRLADRIVTRLPVDTAGVWLLRQTGTMPYQQATALFTRLFDSRYFDEVSCRY